MTDKNVVAVKCTALSPAFLDRCQEIVDSLAASYSAKIALVTQICDGGLTVRSASTNSENTFTAGDFIAFDNNLFCFRVIDSGAPLYVDASRSGSVTADDHADLPIAYFGFPLRGASGELFGTLCMLEANPQQDVILVQAVIDKFKKIIERELLVLGPLEQSAEKS